MAKLRSEFELLAVLKQMFQVNRFSSNEEIIAETKAFFCGKRKHCLQKIYRNDTEALE